MRNDILSEIAELKSQRQAVILAHNYTSPEVQDAADFVGDSLELSLKARDAKSPCIVFCGVSFMAETAKILAPASTVLNPAPCAGCRMADMADAQAVRKYKAEHPGTVLVAYVNTTAEVKAEVDICCTSANAERIVASIPADAPIMFLPDRHLGSNITNSTGRKMEFWPGCCPIHHDVTPAPPAAARRLHPGAVALVHPECPPETVAAAGHALSTGGMLRLVKNAPETEFIVGTEYGILHRMRKENPGKRFYELDPRPCCDDMKLVTLEKIRDALRDGKPEVVLPADLMDRARRAIERMLEIR
ncbi:MAG: quinolinate synthase NadA [Lentisphaeria bacterium]|nr:quinolinate synthase NadA [Lentisphaeria bacterium]